MSVILTHHLRTQAVRLLVPPVVIVDQTLLTSFRAALMLGLREILGGDPDHLDIVTAIDPSPGSVERWAMVLHDLVPGGTGYLSRFADPEQVQQLLTKARDVLAACPCQDEGVAACHRCLLPHVPPFQSQQARRDRALELLNDILADWVPEQIASLDKIIVGPHDTPVERRFRQLVLRWAKGQGASITTNATSVGDRATMLFPQKLGGIRWKLTPQVNHAFVRPDFDLSCDDPNVPTIAVFCDGVRYHASSEHNRVADDAVKRHELREHGLLVWSVTHNDLDVFERVLDGDGGEAPGWATPTVTRTAADYGIQLCQAGDAPATDVLLDTLSVMVRLLLRPQPERWAPTARSATLALAGSISQGSVTTTVSALPALVRANILGETLAPPAGTAQLLVGRTANGATLGVDVRSAEDVRAILAIDDRGEKVGDPSHLAAWRDWLSLGNVLQLLGSGHCHIDSVEQLPDDPSIEPPTSISPPWRILASSLENHLADLVLALAAAGAPLPEAGLEVDDGEHLVDIAWPDRRLAVIVDYDHERDQWLTANGWTVVPAEKDAVLTALNVKRES